jgi:hypothetical protein
MDEYDLSRLPVHGQPDGAEPEDDETSCSPKIYVSNEEATLLAALKNLRNRAVELRQRLKTDADCDREQLSNELEELRRQRADLERRRERAYLRKMVMLGHLPPSALDE